MKLVRLSNYSGSGCTIYSVLEDDGVPSYQKFLQELSPKYDKELSNINGRIITIGEIGALEHFFKMCEWKDDRKICCLYDDPDTFLRLFAIRFESEKILILGGGGVKPKDIRAWQENPKLKREAELIIMVSEIIDKKLSVNDLAISDDELKLTGNLNIP